MLPKQHRLTKDHQFRRLKRNAATIRTPLFLMNYLENDAGMSRFGFITTKKMGNAVERNRATRVMREAVHQLLPSIQEGHDFVFVLHRQMVQVQTAHVQKLLYEILKEQNLLL